MRSTPSPWHNFPAPFRLPRGPTATSSSKKSAGPASEPHIRRNLKSAGKPRPGFYHIAYSYFIAGPALLRQIGAIYITWEVALFRSFTSQGGDPQEIWSSTPHRGQHFFIEWDRNILWTSDSDTVCNRFEPEAPTWAAAP